MDKKIQNITEKYYSNFCGVDLSKIKQGVYYIKDEKRDNVLKGLGCKYSIYILIKNNTIIISYSPKYEKYILSIKNLNISEQIYNIKKLFGLKKYRLMIFKKEKTTDTNKARILIKEDYKQYKCFFKKCYPNAKPDNWLEDYFLEKVNKRLFVGAFDEKLLVAVSDAPDMPYLEGKIQHTGIATLPEYRNKGYAKQASSLATHNLLKMGIVPQWECEYTNSASYALAKSIGYEEYAITYILEENSI